MEQTNINNRKDSVERHVIPGLDAFFCGLRAEKSMGREKYYDKDSGV